MMHSEMTKMCERFLTKWRRKFPAHAFDILPPPQSVKKALALDDCVRSVYVDGEYTSIGVRPMKDWLNSNMTEEAYFDVITERIKDKFPKMFYTLRIGSEAPIV